MAKDNKDGGEVVESTIDISEIPGEEKAAILLLSLNEEDAAGIIRKKIEVLKKETPTPGK